MEDRSRRWARMQINIWRRKESSGAWIQRVGLVGPVTQPTDLPTWLSRREKSPYGGKAQAGREAHKRRAWRFVTMPCLTSGFMRRSGTTSRALAAAVDPIELILTSTVLLVSCELMAVRFSMCLLSPISRSRGCWSRASLTQKSIRF
jgi:hypothetical protein